MSDVRYHDQLRDKILRSAKGVWFTDLFASRVKYIIGATFARNLREEYLEEFMAIWSLPSMVPDAYSFDVRRRAVVCLEVGDLWRRRPGKKALWRTWYWALDSVHWELLIIHCPFESAQPSMYDLLDVALESDDRYEPRRVNKRVSFPPDWRAIERKFSLSDVALLEKIASGEEGAFVDVAADSPSQDLDEKREAIMALGLAYDQFVRESHA